MFYTVNVGKEKWDFYCCHRGCFCLISGLLNTALIVVKCICLWFALYRITITFFGGELLSINHAILVQCNKI